MPNVYVTRKKYESLRDSLDDLTCQKQKIAIDIAEAAGQGDLRENAAYSYAKQQQEKILGQINEIQNKLGNSKILDTLQVDRSHIRIGATVTLQEVADGKKLIYTLVGSEESDPDSGAMSVDTPLSQAMLGKREGETFTVALAKSTKTFKINKLEYK